jgi:hypothetical protein
MDEINEIINWYCNLPKDYSNVNELMYHRQRLVGYYFHYATQLGELRKLWNVAQAQKENELAKREMTSLEKSSTKARVIAKANTSSLLTIEKQAEGNYYAHKENLEAIKEVLSAMSQSIAVSRNEWINRNQQHI